MSKQKLWAVKEPNGKFLPYTIQKRRKDSIDMFELFGAKHIGETWKEYYKKGYQVVKVTIIEQEDFNPIQEISEAQGEMLNTFTAAMERHMNDFKLVKKQLGVVKKGMKKR